VQSFIAEPRPHGPTGYSSQSDVGYSGTCYAQAMLDRETGNPIGWGGPGELVLLNGRDQPAAVEQRRRRVMFKVRDAQNYTERHK